MTTTEYAVKISRGYNKTLTLETRIHLHDDYYLSVTTQKINNLIVTTASRIKTLDGGGFEFSFSDFRAIVEKSRGRATEKTLMEQHKRALSRADELKTQCAKHHAMDAAA